MNSDFNTPIIVDGLTFNRIYYKMPIDKYNIVYKRKEKGSFVFIIGFYNDGKTHPVVSIGEVCIKILQDEVEREYCRFDVDNKHWCRMSLFGDIISEFTNNLDIEENANIETIEKLLQDLGIKKGKLKCEFEFENKFH